MKTWVGALITCTLIAGNVVFAALNARERKEETKIINAMVDQFNQKEEMRKKTEQYIGFH